MEDESDDVNRVPSRRRTDGERACSLSCRGLPHQRGPETRNAGVPCVFAGSLLEVDLVANRGDACARAGRIRVAPWRPGDADAAEQIAARFDQFAATNRDDARQLADARTSLTRLGLLCQR